MGEHNTPLSSLDIASLRHRAEGGSPEAHFVLGVRCYKGHDGASEDYPQAVAWFNKAADQGNANAQNWLGCMHEYGQGVTENYSEALAWYQRAAEQGHADAQFRLGNFFRYGRPGIAQDFSRALVWFRRAADQGYTGAQNDLGAMYHDGLGVPQDYSKALLWFHKAAAQGYAHSQAWLGDMYQNGEGIPQDCLEARAWYQKAADQGYQVAKSRLGWLETIEKMREVTKRSEEVSKQIEELTARFASRIEGQTCEPDGHQANRLTETEPYETLGVRPECTNEELKEAYRQKVNYWHPDKFHAAQIPKEMKDLATREMAKVNEAYHKLKDARGLGKKGVARDRSTR